MEQKKPLGYLFNSIVFYSENDLNNLIDNISLEQSIHIISKAVDVAHQSNIYTLQEAELLSKSMRILTHSLLEKIIEK